MGFQKGLVLISIQILILNEGNEGGSSNEDSCPNSIQILNKTKGNGGGELQKRIRASFR